MKKLLWILLVVVISSLSLLISCDSSSSGGGTADPGELAGTWLATGEDGGVGKAMIFDLTATEFRRIAFSEEPDDMIQEEGAYGTYEVSGSDFIVSITHEWNEGNQQWEESESEITVPYTFDGTTLSMELVPDMVVDFTQVTFVQQAALSDTSWYTEGETDELELNADGTYLYEHAGSGYTASGNWEATENLLRTITTGENGNIIYVENLYEYAMDGDDIVLSWGGSEKFRYTSPE